MEAAIFVGAFVAVWLLFVGLVVAISKAGASLRSWLRDARASVIYYRRLRAGRRAVAAALQACAELESTFKIARERVEAAVRAHADSDVSL